MRLSEISRFTLDSIRLYRKHYPDAWIILSAWEDEGADNPDAIRDDKTLVMLSERTRAGERSRTRYQFYAAVPNAAGKRARQAFYELSKNYATVGVASARSFPFRLEMIAVA